MTTFLLLTLSLRVLLATLCIGVCGLLFRRTLRNGLQHHANLDAWVSLTFAMWWYIAANAEFWFFRSQLLQTFGIVVWIPCVLTVGRYAYVLWRVQ